MTAVLMPLGRSGASADIPTTPVFKASDRKMSPPEMEMPQRKKRRPLWGDQHENGQRIPQSGAV
ncbi:hypothetical protein B9L19_03970 [Geobacillus thermocatenulatus]|uniref:Uncharacterized protein n=1 Tax=Geobacillus thermocatenulatus TaxID=33938 RepID=A0A226Q9T6_9BACL|nr:hypothetical protein GT3921_05240 [Geobacillus thermocatenulatus]KLR74103.1 hypothetical protein ABH20_07375 [Geobacillus sp. T6]OXB89243.1 hypothetical protein B9L19_03970 [Geobacillus thermocatenulatus]RAN22432.1 hypothetical protein VC88_11330 [Geobacillus sp. A8]